MRFVIITIKRDVYTMSIYLVPYTTILEFHGIGGLVHWNFTSINACLRGTTRRCIIHRCARMIEAIHACGAAFSFHHLSLHACGPAVEVRKGPGPAIERRDRADIGASRTGHSPSTEYSVILLN